MSLHEDLSRLLDEDLSKADADALWRRIDKEPEVARVWAEMRHLQGDLTALENEPPPHGLDQQVLDRVNHLPPIHERRHTRSPAPWLAMAGWVVAAAALLLLMPRGTADVLLLEGSEGVEGRVRLHEVDGRVRLHVADVRVEVDGRALVSVEPRGGSARVSLEEDPMNVKTHLAAAFAGAVITVAVYEGSARIFPPEAEPITVAAGETRTVSAPPAEVVHDAAPRLVLRTVPVTAVGTGTRPADSEDHIAALAAELAQLKFEQALTRGQLAHTRGEPVAWPAKVDPSLEPETFERRLQEALLETEAGELLAVDCEEYPCIAYVELDPELGMDQLRPVLEGLADKVSGESDPAVMQMVRVSEEDGVEQTVLTMALFPEDQADVLGKRVEYRAESGWEDLGQGDGQDGP